MENPKIVLSLKLNDINLILESLGKMPFGDVVTLITEIREQGEEQLKQLQKSIDSNIDL